MTHSGNATLAHFKFLLFPILFTANTNLGIEVTPPAHPRFLFDPIVFVLVQCSYPEQPIYKSSERATSPAGNCASTVWRRLWGRFFSRFSFIRISDMVNTRSSHPLQPQLLQPPLSAPGVSSSPELADFLKSMVESMEVLRKQNEELNARLTAAEARSSEKERRDRVHREKRLVNPNQQDHESTVQRGRRMIHDEEHRNKSRRVESPNRGSRRERSRHEGSRQERHEEERSHRSRRHRDKSHHDESQHNLHNAKMKDLEDKYSRILRRMNGEDPKLMAWDMLEDEDLPFTERVKAYPIPNKFKMPRIEKYDGSGDPQAHLEAFRESIILHGTPDEIACRAFPLTLKGVAKDWFTRLPSKSVGTFKEL
jgi:hypothetical protein